MRIVRLAVSGIVELPKISCPKSAFKSVLLPELKMPVIPIEKCWDCALVMRFWRFSKMFFGVIEEREFNSLVRILRLSSKKFSKRFLGN